MSEIKKVFADGGVCFTPDSGPVVSRSIHGGAWAYCYVDTEGERIKLVSAFLTPAHVSPELDSITNNMAEIMAALLALEGLPDGWSGQVCLDSLCTIRRLSEPVTWEGVPLAIKERVFVCMRRLGRLSFLLLADHPSPKDLERGYSEKRGFPVSIHNKACDLACGERIRNWREVNGYAECNKPKPRKQKRLTRTIAEAVQEVAA